MKPVRENIQPHSGDAFRSLEIDQPKFDAHYHFHPEIELTYILESTGQCIIGDSINRFKPNDLLLIGSHLPHQFHNWKAGRARAFVVQFQPDIFGEGFFKTPAFQHIGAMLKQSKQGLKFSNQISQKVFCQMKLLYQSARHSSQAIHLIRILDTLSRDSASSTLASLKYSESTGDRKIARLKRILSYIEEHWQQSITLEEIARAAALHPQSVSRFFQQHLGMNYRSYLVQLRLSHAARELTETDQSITRVAFDCGFNNLSNFNRQFKILYGKTPNAYRKNFEHLS